MHDRKWIALTPLNYARTVYRVLQASKPEYGISIRDDVTVAPPAPVSHRFHQLAEVVAVSITHYCVMAKVHEDVICRSFICPITVRLIYYNRNYDMIMFKRCMIGRHEAMERYTSCICNQSVENNDSYEADRRDFRTYFNIGRHDPVPSAHAIKLWIRNFEATESAMKRKPSDGRTTVSSL
ncbi:hypothetical protein ANN_02554 [Periplaneta americana]|uniref:Uncharacterized protein n=1 Tax=Periplaneta americana TaxID=6978 RepID=A0ABQ8U035_PERAM|nr:hypothetical protein ANN_02554 [Periplaneta americana]